MKPGRLDLSEDELVEEEKEGLLSDNDVNHRTGHSLKNSLKGHFFVLLGSGGGELEPPTRERINERRKLRCSDSRF